MKKSGKILIVVLSLIIVALLIYIVVDKLSIDKNASEQVLEKLPSDQNASETVDEKLPVDENNNEQVTEKLPSDQNVNKVTDYSKYIGAWSTSDNEGNIEIKKIDSESITYTWSIFRIGRVKDITLPLKDNKATFYYQGFDDKNFNSKEEQGEHYIRKATIQLLKDNVTITVENATSKELSENITLDKTDSTNGFVYVTPEKYTFIKK